jgi:hypothetical protein
MILVQQNIEFQYSLRLKHIALVYFTCSNLFKNLILSTKRGLSGVEGSSVISRLSFEANKRKGMEWKENGQFVREINSCKVDLFHRDFSFCVIMWTSTFFVRVFTSAVRLEWFLNITTSVYTTDNHFKGNPWQHQDGNWVLLQSHSFLNCKNEYNH